MRFLKIMGNKCPTSPLLAFFFFKEKKISGKKISVLLFHIIRFNFKILSKHYNLTLACNLIYVASKTIVPALKSLQPVRRQDKTLRGLHHEGK